MKSNGLHITFIDTLGLVENSFHGEGMGNKALSDLHNVDDLNIIENAILHHERTAFTEIGGQYRNYEVRVLLKAWKVLAGFNRPEIIHDHAHANQSALPEKCTAAAIVDINMARKFIRAEVISYRDFKKFNGDRDKLLTEKLIKVQGKKYIVNDGDIIEFKYKLTK
eukprot:gene16883-22371_t